MNWSLACARVEILHRFNLSLTRLLPPPPTLEGHMGIAEPRGECGQAPPDRVKSIAKRDHQESTVR